MDGSANQILFTSGPCDIAADTQFVYLGRRPTKKEKRGKLARNPFIRLGCQWGYHRVWIVRLPIALVDFSRIDLLFVVR
jgi:hypothetical protein